MPETKPNQPDKMPALRNSLADTAGFTDQVFGMMHLLGFKLAPRIRNLNLGETKLFVPPGKLKNYPTLQSMLGACPRTKDFKNKINI